MLVAGMPHVDGHLDEPGDDIARIGADLHEPNRGPAVWQVAHRQCVDRLDHPRSAAQCIAARFHGCRPGMCVLPGPDAVVPGEPQRSRHHAHDLVFALENGSLLDVRLEISVERASAHGRISGIADIL